VLVVELVIFDKGEAALKKKPYEARLHTTDATAEQCVSGVALLGILTERVQKITRERFPGALESYVRGDPMLKYGTGQVTGVEDAQGQQVYPPDPNQPGVGGHEEDDPDEEGAYYGAGSGSDG
jgi:hypothetical protein